jgi:uncharacterized protein (UPF0332 family)
MIKDEDRQSLINYRLEQAKDTVELSRFLIDSEKLVVAVNRIYYGLYYAVTALAIKHRFETSKHLQLIGWFNKEFIASQKLDKKYGKILRIAYQNRTKGDYDAFVQFDAEEVEIMHLEVKKFIKEIEKLILA